MTLVHLLASAFAQTDSESHRISISDGRHNGLQLKEVTFDAHRIGAHCFPIQLEGD